MSAPNPFDQFSSPQDVNPFDQFDRPHYGNNEVLPGGARVPVGSPEAIAAHSPTRGFLQNTLEGVGGLYNGMTLGARQLYAQLTGGNPQAATSPFTGDTAAEERQVNAPLNATAGGKVGALVGAAPFAFLPGVNSYAGAAALGGSFGALQPTVGDESRLLNTGIGGAAGVAGKFVGDSFSNWLRTRATQPFMGWTPGSADSALAEAVGSDAKNLNQPAIGARSAQLGNIFESGRSAATNIDLSSTPSVLDQIANEVNPSARQLLENNPNVMDLTSHATGIGQVNGQMLGKISTGLRQDASTALNTEGGNREVGLALQRVREHVEDMIQSNIGDPALQADYAAARPQYGLLQDVRYNPSVLNASTGRANMEALGKYLQRNNPAYSAGTSDSALFNAAAWGQAGGGAKGVPSFSLGTPWKIPFYAATHNPLSRALGGAISRTLAPVSEQVSQATEGAFIGGSPEVSSGLNLALPYLTQ